MNIEEFEVLFKEEIRVLLDWDQLSSTQVDVRAEAHDQRSLGGLLTVWYSRPGGEPGSWREPEARPLTVREAVKSRHLWDADRRARVDALSQSIATVGGAPLLTLPAYRVGGERLLLDGTHRAAAALQAEVECRVLLMVLDGPLDEGVLPDLGRWAVERGLTPDPQHRQ